MALSDPSGLSDGRGAKYRSAEPNRRAGADLEPRFPDALNGSGEERLGHVTSGLGNQQVTGWAQQGPHLREKRLGLRYLVDHPERQDEVRDTFDPESIRRALTKPDSVNEASPFSPSARAFEHLALDIYGNDPAPGADQLRQGQGEETQPTANVHDGVPRAYEVAEDRSWIMNKPPKGVVERVAKPPRTGVGAQVESPMQQPCAPRTAHTL
ncbi:MAG: hypothetical protein Q8N53_19065 [Longimicrobiales bacterium]|nr:hypothetical protein [Longimicrobiales bacterium]